MKTMKKIFALTLALMLVFSLALTANAANTVTIQNAQNGETYEIYKMLDVKSQDGDKIVYQIAEGWDAFFQQDDVMTYFDVKTDKVVVAKDAFNDAAAATVAGLAATYVSEKDELVTESITATEGTTTASLDDGYYLMTSTVGGENKKSTLVNINGASLTIREKNTPDGLPDIEKEIGDNGTGYKVGDTFNSTIKVTCAEGATQYTVVDTMTGLELVSNTDEFVVKYNDTEISPNITINAAKNGFTIEMEFATPTKAYDKITIAYTVKVTEAGVNEITNTATIKDTNITDSDQAKNGGFELTKKDKQGQSLGGAKFKLYSDEACTTEVLLHNAGAYYRPVIGQEQGEAIVAGDVTIKGLGAGTYYLKEIEAPAGYVMDYTVHTVTINPDAESVVTIEVTNVKGEELPETGGMGTTVLYIMGGLMVAGAAVLLITKKRMSAM